MKLIILFVKSEGCPNLVIFENELLAREIIDKIDEKYYTVFNRTADMHGDPILSNGSIFSYRTHGPDFNTYHSSIRVHPIQLIPLILREFGDKFIIRTDKAYPGYTEYSIDKTKEGYLPDISKLPPIIDMTMI